MNNIIELLCTRLSFSRNELIAYVRTCPHRYKVYPIEKRSGKGVRIIAQPSKDLKAVQRILLDEVLTDLLPVHSRATAYRSGKSILDNAKPHLKNQFLLKMDFTDFFPSISATDFVQFLGNNEFIVDDNEQKILALIFFMQTTNGLRLSIGSPGSPLISNALLYDFDTQMFDNCSAEKIEYTRYSDDLTLSTGHRGKLFDWPMKTSLVLQSIANPKLSLNEQKTVFSSKKFNRHVTGITITNDEKASIGRSRKREIRTLVYQAPSADKKGLLQTKGKIAFAQSIEPQFVKGLWKKYPTAMKTIMSTKSKRKGP